MITPADIEYKQFSKAVRGYNEDEVDSFLDLIIVDMENLIRENKKLKGDLERVKAQAEQQSSAETSVYETLETAKSLMNDIAASAERRAEVLIKNAELEASLITKESKESISKLTDEGNRLRGRVENLRNRYKKMLEDELERVSYVNDDLLEEFEKEFLPASMTPDRSTVVMEPISNPAEDKKQDLTKTIVNLR